MMSIGKTIEGIFDQEPLNWDPNRSKMQNLKKFYEFYKSSSRKNIYFIEIVFSETHPNQRR
jgi:hypothetical protein